MKNKAKLALFASIKDELMKLMNDILEPLHNELENEIHFPYDIFLTDDETTMVISVEIPGVPKENLTIESLDNFLEISGFRSAAQERGVCLALERASGSFNMLIYLARPVNVHKARAVLKDGVLEIRVPVISEKRGKKNITIL